jgi:hypothetical protein
VDAADQRHRHGVERVQHAGGSTRVVEVLFARVADHLRHPVDVGAGAEDRSGPLQDRHANRPVRCDGFRPLGQLADEIFVERVADVGTVEGQRRDRAGGDEK